MHQIAASKKALSLHSSDQPFFQRCNPIVARGKRQRREREMEKGSKRSKWLPAIECCVPQFHICSALNVCQPISSALRRLNIYPRQQQPSLPRQKISLLFNQPLHCNRICRCNSTPLISIEARSNSLASTFSLQPHTHDCIVS